MLAPNEFDSVLIFSVTLQQHPRKLEQKSSELQNGYIDYFLLISWYVAVSLDPGVWDDLDTSAGFCGDIDTCV